jgi:hypothetical protein
MQELQPNKGASSPIQHLLERQEGGSMTADFDPQNLPCLIAKYFYVRLALAKLNA